MAEVNPKILQLFEAIAAHDINTDDKITAVLLRLSPNDAPAIERLIIRAWTAGYQDAEADAQSGK